MLRAGEVVKLKVERNAPFGYFLSDGTTDVLLHQNEALGEIQIGESITVFLYHDHQNRLAATCHMPKITYGETDWLKVVDVVPNMGVFLDIGISKQLLLPKDELPYAKENWPKEGFEVFVTLGRDRQGRMVAHLADEKELSFLRRADQKMHNREVTGRVYRITQLGAAILTDDGFVGLIHRDEMTSPLALGQKVIARVTHVRDDGKLNLSMKPRKEVSYSIDAERIFTYLQQRGGSMPYGDQTDPEIIQLKFQMSKSAFKRALGKLMKENRVKQQDGWTYILEDEKT